jgi:hypothetical protein
VTTNGGSTWTSQTSGTTQNLRCVALAGVSNTFACGGLGTILNNTDQAFPVELTTFTAAIDKSIIKLHWSTASEINCYGFVIERQDRAGDSKISSPWARIGFVAGSGNSNAPRNYSFADHALSTGEYAYRLQKIDQDGSYDYSHTVHVSLRMRPDVLEVGNYPNPFNPTTNVHYSIPYASVVKLSLFNMLGQHVATLVDEYKEAGTYQITFDGSTLSSGMYLYTLQAGGSSITKKMLLLK